MPVVPSYPGVYIEEIPSGVRTIASIATSITAFIGRALRGPANEPILINSYGDFERIFGGLWVESTLGYAVRDFYLNGGSQAVIVRLFKPTEGADHKSRAQLNLGLSDTDLILEAADEGEWGNKLIARVDYDFFPQSSDDEDKEKQAQEAEKDGLFNLSIKDDNSGKVEVFRNVSVLLGHHRRIDNVLKNESQLVRVFSGVSAEAKRPPASASPTEWDKKVEDNNKATDGDALDNNSFTGTGMEGSKEGLYALEKTDLFSLLCIPPYKGDGAGADVDAALIESAIAYCKKRRAMLIIDAPSKWGNKESAKEGIKEEVGSTSENAAIFFPRLKQPNPLKNNQIEVFAACGAIAGVFSRTDTQRGIWKAPAGLEATLVGVPELSVPLTDGEIGELNPLGINCLRTVPAAGRVIWGSRTRLGDDRLASEWKYISVRRLALYIQESLYRGTQWIVFEPNDEPLWAQIRLNLGAFMNNLFRKGAFQGSSPKEAYFVKCDKETTTQNDINLGIVNIVVGFAPLKPAEFVIIKFQQIAGQIAG